MPLRKLTPLTFRAKGLSDAADGTNAFPGAMQSLQNLVHAPHTTGVFVPRAAAEKQTSFAGFTTPGVISVLEVIGTRVYGLVASGRNAGKDEPFCYDLVAQAFIAVSGITNANSPTTQSTSGDWTPPTIAAVTNSRIMVTHPGFPGGAGPYIGFFDISGFTLNTLTGIVTNGLAVITSINDGGTSAPIIDGVQVGQTVSGTGIPAGTTVKSLTNGSFSLGTIGSTHSNTTLDAIGSLTGVLVGMQVAGPGIVPGTYVAALPGGAVVTLSQAATATGAGVAINFSGGGTITMSAPATATNNLVALTIAGGTAAAPLWGAGNTNTNVLSTVPVAVAGFNGRAWYAVNNAVVGSDALNPLQVSFASQALLLGDNTPVTALAGLPLTSQLTGGIVQALVAFKGAQPFYQITGDFVGATLAANLNAGSVGTLAPNTICGTPMGLAFIAPDGLRILSEAGTLTEPIGAFGKGVSVPFINALNPSRMAAAYGQNTIRVSCQNSQAAGQPKQEYFLQMQEQSWSGPHTFPAALIESYIGNGKVGFISAPEGVTASLWFHTVVPLNASTYTENLNPLSWMWTTSLLPDNEQMKMNRMGQTDLALVLSPTQTVIVTAADETGAALDMVSKTGPPGGSNPLWGVVNWGAFNWGALGGYFKQFRVAWHLPLIFKQMTISVAGASQAGFAIGNLYMGYQVLGYMLQGDGA